MSWNGSGTFSRLMNWVADKAANINITASRMDTDSNDFASGINACLAKNGENSPTANLPMANFKHTGVLSTSGASSRTEYASTATVQDGAVLYTASAGTDTYTANLSPAIAAYATGAEYNVTIGNPNTSTTPTLALNGLAAKTIVRPDGSALIAGDLNGAHHLRYDGVNLRVLNPKKVNASDISPAGAVTWTGLQTFSAGVALSGSALNEAQGADIASAATINLDTATGNLVDVTGTTTITAITLSQGRRRLVRFTGALILTNGASLVLPGGGNITTAAGDYAEFEGYAAGVVRCSRYAKASGAPVSMSPITASLGGDVALNNTGTFFDGPSIAQGSTGTWFVSGTVTLTDTVGGANFGVNLWDGTTVIASATVSTSAAGTAAAIALSGFITNPAGNLRISAKDSSATTGAIKFNSSGSSKDSTISAVRIA